MTASRAVAAVVAGTVGVVGVAAAVVATTTTVLTTDSTERGPHSTPLSSIDARGEASQGPGRILKQQHIGWLREVVKRWEVREMKGERTAIQN